MKKLLVILLGIPFVLGACTEKEEPFSYESAILWHHQMYGSLYSVCRTHDPILLRNRYEQDIFYSGCQYALEHVMKYRDMSIKSTQ